MTATAAKINIATDKFPVCIDWDIKILESDVKNLNRFLILKFTNQDGDPNNHYTDFEGVIFDDSSPTPPIPICGIYTTDVITFHFHTLTDTYVFTGLCKALNAITNGRVYKGDPTDDGSWSGTAQQ